jgi:maltooligosyltrehalose trehalohydrolase
MGQEFGASSPFLFFTDHRAELAEPVHEGRRDFLAQFPSYGGPEARARVPAPHDPATFERSRLDLAERERHAPLYRFHEELLRLRREDPLVARQARDRLDGAVLDPAALAVRYFGDGGDDRLLLVNVGPDLEYDPAPEPLLAPPGGREWRLVFSSDDPRYGGQGVVSPCGADGRWRLPGGSASFLAAVPSDRPRPSRQGEP